MKMTQETWSLVEVEATVADYMAMLADDLRGAPVNKAEHNRALRRQLRGRTQASVEFKHRNISAVLVECGYDYLDGYRPAPNVQDLLRTVVRRQLFGLPELAAMIARVVERPAVSTPGDGVILPRLVPSPKPMEHAKAVREWGAMKIRPLRTNYAELEARNRSLGDAGEHAALAFEHQRLWTSGKRALANRIEHVAKTRGDGCGFDVLSFESDGRERMIEVKTTRLAELTPFYVSRNELEASKHLESQYHLYRLYRFERSPKLFILKGSLASSCRLDPVVFRADVA